MELTPQLLAEVEFRDTLRGYDRDEVDSFLEQVGVAIAELQTRLRDAVARAESAPPARPDSEADGVSTDTITRTLLLAQRTADGTIAEAEEEARRVLADATAEADRLVADATTERSSILESTEHEARQVAEETRRQLLDELSQLEGKCHEKQAVLAALESELDRQRELVATAAARLQALLDERLLDSHRDPASDDPAGRRADEHGDSPIATPSVVGGDEIEPVRADHTSEAAPRREGGDEGLRHDSAGGGGAIDLSETTGPYDVDAEAPVETDPADESEPPSSVFDESGPVTQAVDVLALDDGDQDDDIFVRQLRDAVRPDAPAENDTMSQFFEDDAPRRLFGRRSD